MANDQHPQNFVLNVLIHGGLAFYEEPKKVTVLLPRSDHHVYRAGNWLAETELLGQRKTDEPKIVYELMGVKKGNDKFNANQNLIVKNSHPGLRGMYATLEFLTPKRITSLRQVEIPRDLFREGKRKAPRKIAGKGNRVLASTLQVFTYDVNDINNLKLVTKGKQDGHYWEPLPTGPYINLHILCSEDHFQPSYAKNDFDACVKLLGVPRLTIDTHALPSSEITDPTQVPAGVSPEETEGLPHRTQRMARLGSLVRQKGDANLAWAGNDALNDDPSACYQTGGRGL